MAILLLMSSICFATGTLAHTTPSPSSHIVDRRTSHDTASDVSSGQTYVFVPDITNTGDTQSTDNFFPSREMCPGGHLPCYYYPSGYNASTCSTSSAQTPDCQIASTITGSTRVFGSPNELWLPIFHSSPGQTFCSSQYFIRESSIDQSPELEGGARSATNGTFQGENSGGKSTSMDSPSFIRCDTFMRDRAVNPSMWKNTGTSWINLDSASSSASNGQVCFYHFQSSQGLDHTVNCLISEAEPTRQTIGDTFSVAGFLLPEGDPSPPGTQEAGMNATGGRWELVNGKNVTSADGKQVIFTPGGSDNAAGQSTTANSAPRS